MRGSALSNLWAIDLLNRYYVPVYISTAEYDGKSSRVPAEEQAEYRRIIREIHQAKLPSGLQLAAVLTPDGRPVDTMAGCHAAIASNLIDLLTWNSAMMDSPGGDTLIAPRPQSRPPQAAADAVVLHLTARYLKRQGSERVPCRVKFGEDNSGNWNTCPAENWIVLDRAQCTKLLPAGPVQLGVSWSLDPDLVDYLLRHFYPPTEDNDLAKNRIDRSSLRATVTRVSGDRVRARLEGELRMRHCFYPNRDEDRFVDASVLGYLDFEPGSQRIRSLQLCTPQATYGTDEFGVAVRSVP
jgi:hypothetical protein